MPAPTSRSAAARTALLAQAALGVCALGGTAAVLTFPSIKDPEVAAPTDIRPPEGQDQQRSAAPPDVGVIGRVLTTAANFPPPPRVDNPDDGPGPGTGPNGGPASSTGPVVRFLGAIAEPDQYVALLSIDGRQKFLRVGDSFSASTGVVRVIACSASEVELEVGPAGQAGARQELELAQRVGAAWTEPPAAGAAVPLADPTMGGEVPASPDATQQGMPGLPPGFVPPQGMSPQQIEEIRRSYQRAQQGDSSR